MVGGAATMTIYFFVYTFVIRSSDLENRVLFAQSPGSSVQASPETGTHLPAMEQEGGDE